MKTEKNSEIDRNAQKAVCDIDDLLQKSRSIHLLRSDGLSMAQLGEMTGYELQYLQKLEQLGSATTLTNVLIKEQYVSVRAVSLMLSIFSAIKTEMLLLHCLWIAREQKRQCSLDCIKQLLSQIDIDDRRLTAGQRGILTDYLSMDHLDYFFRYISNLIEPERQAKRA